jgi:hypothetical protein
VKQLWLSVIHNLETRVLMYMPKADILLALPTAYLIQEVKRAVIGPITWSRNCAALPALARQFVILLQALEGDARAGFLEDGRYIVFYKESGPFATVWSAGMCISGNVCGLGDLPPSLFEKRHSTSIRAARTRWVFSGMFLKISYLATVYS